MRRQVYGIFDRDPTSGAGSRAVAATATATATGRIYIARNSNPVVVVAIAIVRIGLRRELRIMLLLFMLLLLQLLLPSLFFLLLLMLKFVLMSGGPVSDDVYILSRQILHDNGRSDVIVVIIPICARVMPHVRRYCMRRQDVVQKMQNGSLTSEDTGIFELPNLDLGGY